MHVAQQAVVEQLGRVPLDRHRDDSNAPAHVADGAAQLPHVGWHLARFLRRYGPYAHVREVEVSPVGGRVAGGRGILSSLSMASAEEVGRFGRYVGRATVLAEMVTVVVVDGVIWLIIEPHVGAGHGGWQLTVVVVSQPGSRRQPLPSSIRVALQLQNVLYKYTRLPFIYCSAGLDQPSMSGVVDGHGFIFRKLQ